MKQLNFFLIVCAILFIPLGTYFIFKNHNKKQIEWYSTKKPIQKDLVQYINAAGKLKPQDQITVGSLVAGRIVKLHVDDNDFVKKGQILVELDDGIGYSAVKKAKANHMQAQASLAYQENFFLRQKSLYQSGQLAKDTFEQYEKNYITAKAEELRTKAELEIQQQNYDNLFIKAPEDGIIIAKKVDLGQMITARFQATELFIIAKNLKKMEAEIDVDEADIGLVKVGQEAMFTVDSFPRKPFKSKVKQIYYNYNIVDNVITYPVILDVENPKLVLRSGMTTNIDIKIADIKNALCVPNKALRVNKESLKAIAKKENFTIEELPQTIGTKNKDSLWIFTNNNHFKQVPVTLGATSGRYTQVIKGVDTNTTIITEALNPERENPIMQMGKMRA